MHIQISLADGVPIYRQIASQVSYMTASGQLAPGEELPPIRTLAKQLRVTPNTIVKAYRELEVEGVVYKRRGAGTYVSEFMSPLARKERRKILASRVDALLTEARQMDFSFGDVLDLLHKRQSVLWKNATEDDDHVGKCG